MSHRLRFLKFFFFTFAVILIARAAQLASGRDSKLDKLAKNQFRSNITVMPRRGLIFDRNGEGLAISLKVYSLFIRPEVLRKELSSVERNQIMRLLSQILQIPQNQLKAKFNSEKGFVWISRQLSATTENKIREKGLLEYGDGLGLAEETKRFYPNQELASHVLGTVGVDGDGLEGLELFYDTILRGSRTSINSTKDAMGRRIFNDETGLSAFKDGQSLVLTLDKYVQYEAERALKSSVELHEARAGSVIVAEIDTGEVLAMANFPVFNPNHSKHASADSRRNRAITDTYEPGSSFKPLIIGMALEKGRAPNTKIYCEEGKFSVGDRTISESESHEKFRWLTFGEILKFSSNIGAAKVALDLGSQTLSELMDRLAIDRKTEIDLPGEATGRVSRKELRSNVHRANIGFGQGVTVTALQMMSYYLAIANGGQWIKPRMVKAILSEDPTSLERGNIRYRLGARLQSRRREIFSKKTSRQVAKMLETVTEEKGTGVKAQLEEWPVAGKTGTAQKVDPKTHRYSHQKFVSSFIGFAPAFDPKLVAIVLLDEPRKQYYAGETAAPLFKEAMKAALLRQQVKPQGVPQPKELMQPQSSTALAISAVHKEIETVREAIETNEKQVRLPNLYGKTIRDCLRIIGSQPLELEIQGSGFLKEQIPGPDKWMNPRSKVKLIFSAGE